MNFLQEVGLGLNIEFKDFNHFKNYSRVAIMNFSKKTNQLEI